ncbi:MAG: flagellar basal body P-ring protein FlgI [Deltaproteobacteria bacterium]|nr:flagellar basal body P-ring protein FlgI [Deltaproteobacteria bacterium]
MKTVIKAFLVFCFLILGASEARSARIKEIANFEGVRQNPLIGYGLVVGLEGTGDKGGTEFTIQSLVTMLNRMGIRVDADQVKVKNVAAVIVTSELSPFKRPGARVDVTVSSIGDAKSLQGGTLLFTPLKGADGEVYAVAQGPVSIGGFMGGGEGATVQKNYLTVGRISGGGFVEKEIPFQFGDTVSLVLRQPDFTTVDKITRRINEALGAGVAEAVDSTRIKINTGRPAGEAGGTAGGRLVELLSKVEGLDVAVDGVSRVVVNERTGTIVMGANVRISTVAVSHGNLSIEVKTRYRISQPPPFSSGSTVVRPEEEVRVEEQKARLLTMEEGASIAEVVNTLNALGVTPRDLIAILQAIKAAGALQAELEII